LGQEWIHLKIWVENRLLARRLANIDLELTDVTNPHVRKLGFSAVEFGGLDQKSPRGVVNFSGRVQDIYLYD